MGLKDYYKSWEVDANFIPNWKKMTVTELANGYIDNENDELVRDSYFAALVCKYWYMVPYMYKTSKSLNLQLEDYISWIYDALIKGLKYRRWLDPAYKVYYEKDGAKMVFDRALTTIRIGEYKYSNRDKRVVNHNTFSLDTDVENCITIDDIADNNYEKDKSNYEIRCMINKLIAENNNFEAIIVDAICFQDVFKDGSLNDKKLAKYIKNANINYYKTYYDINEMFTNSLISVKKINSKKLYNKISDTLIYLKNIREELCL